MVRIFILGNCGSGKTWLSRRLAERYGIPAIHLDDLHWMPNFAGVRRPIEERDHLVAEAARYDAWAMEGIYGSILRQVFDRVTTLVWLDLPDEECIVNLIQRGQTGGGTDEQFAELLEYTRGYRVRKNHLNSWDGHQALFEQYPLEKFRLCSRQDVSAFLATI